MSIAISLLFFHGVIKTHQFVIIIPMIIVVWIVRLTNHTSRVDSELSRYELFTDSEYTILNLFLLGSWWRLSFQKLTKTKNHSWKKERTFICFLCRLVVKIIYFFQDILLPLSVLDSKVFLLLPLSIGCCSVKLLNPFFFF